jgi:hypothetical protein
MLKHQRVFSVRSEVRIMKQKKLQLYMTFRIFAVASVQIVVFWVLPRQSCRWISTFRRSAVYSSRLMYEVARKLFLRKVDIHL